MPSRALPADRLFVGQRIGHCLFSGRAHRVHLLDLPSRRGVTAAPSIGIGRIYFGDQKANAYAVDAATGKLQWKVHLDDHFAARVTGASLLHKGVMYVPIASFEEVMPLSPSYECCTFRGSLVALDANTGKRIWKTYTIAQAPEPTKISKTKAQLRGPSGASMWSAPTFDEKRDLIYVATGNNYSDPPTETSDAVLAHRAGKPASSLWSNAVDREGRQQQRLQYRPSRPIVRIPMAPISISASRRFWFRSATGAGRW